jgi:DNA-binding NarL/FixJ family response regulator
MSHTLPTSRARSRGDARHDHVIPLHREPTPDGSRSPLLVRLLVADGHGLVRGALRALLDREGDMTVVAEAATGEEALAEAERTSPDVVLIDGALPGLEPIEATRRILHGGGAAGEIRVLLLMTSACDDAVFSGLRAGASGMLLKDARPEELVVAVRVVARGEVLLAPPVAGRVVADFLSRPERLDSSAEQLEELTPREREVVSLVACGLSNDEIAERLVVTRATAKTHVSRALCKLNARDRAQLVVLAYETGLVRPGPRWDDSLARVAEVREHRQHPAMSRGGRGQGELVEDARDVLLDRGERDHELLRDALVGLPFRHRGQHLELARAELAQRTGVPPAAEHPADDIRVEGASAGGHA